MKILFQLQVLKTQGYLGTHHYFVLEPVMSTETYEYRKVAGQSTCLGCGLGPHLRACKRQQINVSLHINVSLPLSPSLPLSLKNLKYFLKSHWYIHIQIKILPTLSWQILLSSSVALGFPPHLDTHRTLSFYPSVPTSTMSAQQDNSM